MKRIFTPLTAVAAAVLLMISSAVAADSDFYKGKTITVIAGTKAGDVYDLYARWFAKHAPKYIPGKPNIIVQNMPGAGSMIAANYVYNVADPDGLTIGAIFPALYFDQIVNRPEVKFDWAKFHWIGSPVTSNHLLYMRADTPYKTIHDVVKGAPASPKCGATGTSSTAFYIPKLLNQVIGTDFEIVLGYQSGQDIDLAVERGELICRSFTITAFFAREPFISWRKKNFVNVLMQTGKKPDPRLQGVPTIHELMAKYNTPPSGKAVATLVLAAGDFGRPYVMPPKTPPERVKTIRNAFQKLVKDEEALAELKKQRLEIDPNPGEELQELAKEVTSQPKDVVAKMKELLGN